LLYCFGHTPQAPTYVAAAPIQYVQQQPQYVVAAAPTYVAAAPIGGGMKGKGGGLLGGGLLGGGGLFGK
jgi:predicted lipid-binding transport protein (Tim44 family)